MKVYELAKELEVQSKDLVEFAESLGKFWYVICTPTDKKVNSFHYQGQK